MWQCRLLALDAPQETPLTEAGSTVLKRSLRFEENDRMLNLMMVTIKTTLLFSFICYSHFAFKVLEVSAMKPFRCRTEQTTV